MNQPSHCRRLLALAVLAACGTAPPPTPPAELALELPRQWASEAPAAASPLQQDWWKAFGDAGLDAFMEQALDHNRDLGAAIARLEALAAARTIAGAPLWPEVDAGLNANRSRRLFLGFPFGGGGVPSTTVSTYGLSLNVRWELDVWGRLRAGESAAIADQQVALADFHGARLSLLGQICRGWFAAIEARQQLDLAEATVAAFRATAADVRDRFRRGVRPALDVHLAETNLANAEATIAQRREVLQRTLRHLDVLAGRYPDGRTGTGNAMPAALPMVPAGLPGELLQRRPDLVAAERRVATTGCRIEAARASLYPALSLTGSAGTTSLDLADLTDKDFRVWGLGANLLEPIFRGGALQAEVARRQALRVEALANYGGAVLRAFAEVEDVLTTDERLAERREHLAAAARHATAARDLARQRYQAGLTDFLTVADGQRQAFQAESARIGIERARLENRIDLFLALGGGYGQTADGAGQ